MINFSLFKKFIQSRVSPELVYVLKSLSWLGLLVVATACTSVTPRPQMDLVGRCSASEFQDGNLAYYQDLDFFEDGTLSFMDGRAAHFVVIAPGRMKITLGDQSDVVGFTVIEDSLKLTFQQGNNLYQQVAVSAHTAEPSPVAAQGEAVTAISVAALPTETPPVVPTFTSTLFVLEALPSSTPTLLPHTAEPTMEGTAFITPTPERYYPIANCATSQLRLGNSTFIAYDGGRNSLRKTADTHPSDNIIGYIYPGEVVEIIDGPVCNYGWVLWKVMTIRYEEGWTAETDGKAFWMLPLGTHQLCPNTLPSRMVSGGEAFVMEEYDLSNFIRQLPSLDATIISRIQPGRKMQVLDGPVCSDASNW